MQTPAEQAAFELRRPQQQFWPPLIVGGFISAYISLGFVFLPPLAVGIFAALFGASVLWARGRRTKQLRVAAGRSLNTAFNLIGLGRLLEASQVLEVVREQIHEPWAQRLSEIQQSIIAIRHGDMAPAERHLFEAIALPVDGYARENAAYQLEGAHALRAFVRAALGKHEEARADIEHVQGTAASDDALARVALAEAMILEQQGKREELRMLLIEKSTLLLEHTHPRERAIVRAFQRMVRSGKASVYRKAEARREARTGEEPELSDWVAKVAPGAAEFVRAPHGREHVAQIVPAAAVARPSEAAVLANIEAKKPIKKTSTGKQAAAVGIVSILVVLVGILLTFMFTSSGAGSSGPGLAGAIARGLNAFATIFAALLCMAPVVFAGVKGLQWLSRRRAEQAVRTTARDQRAKGPPTDAELLTHTRSPSPVVAAQAWLLLADRAERTGDFVKTLSLATSGLSRLSEHRDRLAADIVYPDLLSLRAFALAAMSRFQESNAELASLGPTYPHHSRAVFRARLLMLVRHGDLAGAARWVEQGEADLPLSVREELLSDLVRATVRPEHAGAGEIQRIKDELAGSPSLKTWIKSAAPGLLEKFEGATVADVQMRIADAPWARLEEAADAEAEAELEADAALGPKLALRS